MAKITWRTQDDIDAEKQAQAWTALRMERDRRIAATDWTQLSDAPLTSGEQIEWQQYRQALRDVPQQPGAPHKVIWPEPPVDYSELETNDKYRLPPSGRVGQRRGAAL